MGLNERFINMKFVKSGNCYTTSEAIYHLLDSFDLVDNEAGLEQMRELLISLENDVDSSYNVSDVTETETIGDRWDQLL